jgi:hypothetical protein
VIFGVIPSHSHSITHFISTISDDADFGVMQAFSISNALVNGIVQYFLASPLRQHIMNLQYERTEAGKFIEADKNLKRMAQIEKIISKTLITCLRSIIFTVMNNLLYCIYMYVYPDNPDWYIAHICIFSVEAVCCSLFPLENYPKFNILSCLFKESGYTDDVSKSKNLQISKSYKAENSKKKR